MKQLTLAIGSSNAKKCSLASTKENNAVVSDFTMLDLRPIAVVNSRGFNLLLNCAKTGYVRSSLKDIYNDFFKAVVHYYDAHIAGIILLM